VVDPKTIQGAKMTKVLTLLASACLLTVVVPVVGHAAASPPCFGMKATIVGTPGNDVIHGTHGPDVIRGLGGNDKIFAGGRSDYICGGRGADRIHGDKASPTNFGHVGNDRMSGGRGHDRLVGEGSGSWGLGDTFFADPGDDHMTEGPLDELPNRLPDADFNHVDYSDAPVSISVLVTGGFGEVQNKVAVTGDGSDSIDLWGIGDFHASPYDDEINVQGFVITLAGGGGNDHIVYDGVENEQVFGEEGDDTITFINGGNVWAAAGGGAGNDTFEGTIEPGMDGGPGDDTFINGAGGSGGPGDDSFINSPGGDGGDGNDTMTATAGGSWFDGGNGSDMITGGPGSDILGGGPGDDTINGQDGVVGNDTVDGGDGTDACTYDPGDTVLNCP
jgi:Ca2+-binding RTX toxin-like protein